MPQGLAKAGCANWHHHELLKVDVVVGVHATVDDVHHRHRQHVRIRPTDVAVQRKLYFGGGCLRDGEAHTQNRVCSEACLVVGAVEINERHIDKPLIK